MEADDATLTYLDWGNYSCQWWRCYQSAVNEVHTHVVNSCNNRDHTDVFGDTIHLLCAQHTTELKTAAQRRINRLNRFGRPMCTTCGAPLADAEDIVRSVRRMVKIIRESESTA